MIQQKIHLYVIVSIEKHTHVKFYVSNDNIVCTNNNSFSRSIIFAQRVQQIQPATKHKFFSN